MLMEHGNHSPLRKMFAWRPIKLYNNEWTWLRPVYYRVMYSSKGLEIFDRFKQISEYYTEKDAEIMKLRGEHID